MGVGGRWGTGDGTDDTADAGADAVNEFGVGGVLGFDEDGGGFDQGGDGLEASGFHGFTRFCVAGKGGDGGLALLYFYNREAVRYPLHTN